MQGKACYGECYRELSIGKLGVWQPLLPKFGFISRLPHRARVVQTFETDATLLLTKYRQNQYNFGILVSSCLPQ